MSREPKWIAKRAMLAIHERLLAEFGGAPGLLSEGLLESALDGPKNHFAHGERDIFRLAARYAHALTKNHPFADGNKRDALVIAATFLERNGFRLEAPEQEAVQATLALTEGKLSAAEFAEWLRGTSVALAIRRKRLTVKRRATRRPKKK